MENCSGYDMGIPNHTERHLRIEGDAVELAASWSAVDIDVFLPVPNEVERDAVGASRGGCPWIVHRIRLRRAGRMHGLPPKGGPAALHCRC